MSTTAFHRPPLTDCVYTALSDAAVHMDGSLAALISRAVKGCSSFRMGTLDGVLASRLDTSIPAPAMPDLNAARDLVLTNLSSYAATVRAGVLTAISLRSKEALLACSDAMRVVADNLDNLSEEALFHAGADLLRVTLELYRRTGQPFLTKLLGDLRSRLPDVSGLMTIFPFQTEYLPETASHSPEDQEYYDRMQRFACGKGTADALAMSALLSTFTGSKRDSDAPAAGLASLERYHGMPSGVFSADPYLAGRNPARAADLPAIGAQAEALLDALCATGDAAMAEKLEMLLVNVLPDLVSDRGLRALTPTNRLSADESCLAVEPTADELTALLRTMYVLLRAVWMSHDDETLAYLQPVSCGCVARISGVPMRFTARVEGVIEREITIRVENRQSASGVLRVRVPSYAENAQLLLSGEEARNVEGGTILNIRRPFVNGDEIKLRYRVSPRQVAGYHGSVSIYVGAELMCLRMPTDAAQWRFAVMPRTRLTAGEENGKPYVLIGATDAPRWQERDGFILPPPQGTRAGTAYELTLLPFAGSDGRIAAFPCVKE